MALPQDAVAISAQQGLHLDALLGRIETVLEQEDSFVGVELEIPFQRSDLVDRFHQLGRVDERSFDENGTTLNGWLPEREITRFDPYIRRAANPVAADEPALESHQATSAA